PLGRPAANGGHRSRAHGQPEALGPRRAVARARAAARRVHLRGPARDQRERCVDPPRGAERPGGAHSLTPRVYPRGRPHGGRRERRRPPRRCPRAPRLSRPPGAMNAFLQQLVLGLLIGGLYGLAAAGLSLVFGVLKVLNVAHGQLIMLGGYGAFWLFALRGLDPFASLAVVIPAALVAGGVLYWTLFGWVVRAPEEPRVKNSLLIGLGWTLKALIVVVLAGLGSMLGTFVGGLVLGLAEAVSATVFGGPYREVVGLVVFFVVLVARPRGLFVR